MIIFMIMNEDVKQKLKKCIIGSAAALVLSGCVTTKQGNQMMMDQEIPHRAETSLNVKMVKKQKPIDAEFILQEEAMLKQLAYSELYDVQIDKANHEEQEAIVLQKFADDCRAMKNLTQRAASHYKNLEQVTMQNGKVPELEILDIEDKICSYRYARIHGGWAQNQGLDENTNLDAVRAAYRHCMHKFLDAKILALTGALPSELIAQEKYELGYGVFYNRDFMNNKTQNLDDKLNDIIGYVMDDMVNYVVYEYRHSLPEENPAAIEREMEDLLYEMQQGLNAYGYQGEGAEKDMVQAKQAEQGLIRIMSRVPEMCGKPDEIKVLICELGAGMVMLPTARDLTKKGVDLSKLNLQVSSKAKVTNERSK